MSAVADQPLKAVAAEIGVTLTSIRAALEAYSERLEDPTPLITCAPLLRDIQGVLRVVEVYGAALLAEEMEQVTRYLMALPADQRGEPEGVDALMRAMVQLPAYLERVLAGGRDLALVVLPLLNDLRAVRGQPLLSEGTLLLLNLTSDRQPSLVPTADGEPALSVAQWARELRPRFQLGLLGIIRGERIQQHLKILTAVAERIERTATRQPVFQLWWVVGAVLDSLPTAGAEGSATVKRLLGQADRELRRLHELGEDRYCESPAVDLLNNLLYYVARTSATGPRIDAVRTSFKLHELLPVSEQVEQERESLSAPSVKLMETVAAAIKEDLGHVKDQLDIFTRAPTRQAADLATQHEMLRKIADTLGVLGLGHLRSKVQAQLHAIDEIVSGVTESTSENLISIAAALIEVEDQLDGQLIKLITPQANATEPGHDGERSAEDHNDFQQAQSALLRECIVNLAHIKETMASTIAGHDRSGVDHIPSLLRGISAALRMLERSRAIDVLDRIGNQIKDIVTLGGDAPMNRLDRLADAIVALEYYMETLQSGRSDPWYMLDNAERCLALLETGLDVPAIDSAATSEVEPVETGVFVTTSRLRRHEPGSGTVVLSRESSEASAADAVPISDDDSGQIVEASPEIDADLVELFVEEARDELVKIQVNYANWVRNPLDDASLALVRRSFHTLKGSGRMVGAQRVGDYAWSVENLLNRVISGTQTRGPMVTALLQQAVDRLPELIDALAHRRVAGPDIERIIAQAHALAEGEIVELLPVVDDGLEEIAPLEQSHLPADAAMLVEAADDSVSDEVTAQVPTQVPAHEDAVTLSPPPSEPDNSLQNIYRGEIATHVAALRAFVSECSNKHGPYPVTEGLYRACHTLAGASRMAGIEAGIQLAAPLEAYVRSAHDHGVGLEEDARELLSGLALAFERVAAQPRASLEQVPRHDALLLEIMRLDGASRARIDADAETSVDLELVSEATLTLPMIRPEPMDLGISDSAAAEPVRVLPAPVDSGDATVPSAAFAATVSDVEGLERSAPAAGEMTLDGLATASDAPSHPSGGMLAGADFDPEIAQIFGEEATELLEAAERALVDLRTSPRDAAPATALKRFLHTLKGGARMSGASSMGELAHEIESLLSRPPPDTSGFAPEILDAIEASLDELSRMREALGRGVQAPRPVTLLARIEALHGREGNAAEALLPIDFAPAPTVTAAALPTGAQESATPETAAPEEGDALAAQPAVLLREGTGVEAIEVVDIVGEATRVPAVFAASSGTWTEPDMSANGASTPLDDSGASLFDGAEDDGVRPVPVREDRVELARVDPELLDELLNGAGEVSIQRARLEQQLGSIDVNLGELSRVVSRLREQLRKMEIETEAQILHRYDQEAHRADFDPLELDRYSTLQQYSRALAETTSDVGSLQGLLESQTREAQNLLMQQARVVTDLQNGLMRTRMIPFQRHVPRLARTVRQVSAETGKSAELVVVGTAGEMDRQVLERMVAPFEHLLRNAVVHGIEPPQRRRALGKPEQGRIEVSLRREAAEMVIVVQDDGAGLDLGRIREKALATGLIQPRQSLSDAEAMQLILEPGFSTASAVTPSAGRGVGMDVVTTEIKRLGGSLHIDSTNGQGTRFTIRLPFTLAVAQALIVRSGTEIYALPLATVESVVRLPRAEVVAYLAEDAPTWSYGGQVYRFQHLGTLIGAGPTELPEADVPVPLILIRAGDNSSAILADELVGSREVVVKNVGPQIATVRGISGATILGDGRVVMILDLGALVRGGWRTRVDAAPVAERTDRRTLVLVVDDSITVRRVTQRLLERNGMRVMTARDGREALTLLADHVPDVILLDIEMPRMDGYELAAHVRADARLSHVPIVMITSRVGEKHRARAIELGVDDYLGKPYQESQLLDAIEPLVARGRSAQ